MAACTLLRSFSRLGVKVSQATGAVQATWCRRNNSLSREVLDKHRKTKYVQTVFTNEDEEFQTEPNPLPEPPKEYRDVYPDFLPNPAWWIRDKLTEKLEREDMFKRRAVMDIPEFYVGTIMAVIVADKFSAGKKSRFVGTCIHRGGHGLRSYFILRNVIDDEGIEVMYEMYNPILQKIEVLRLEKRLDDELFYLRDAAIEYSYVPQNIEPIQLPKGRAVPINSTKVKLNPRPWLERWERKDLKGVELVELPEKVIRKAEARKEPWEKYDLMKQYRARINDEEAADILSEVYDRQNKQSHPKNKKNLPKS